MHTPQSTKPAGFTLVELMVVIMIIAILSSLTLAGLMTARTRAKYTKTESTIRKIHEIIMPHYEEFLNRGNLPALVDGGDTLTDEEKPLVRQRRAIAVEMPDSWIDMSDSFDTDAGKFVFNSITVDKESTATRCLRQLFSNADRSSKEKVEFADAETLYALVMYGGFADPNIVVHFRSDEFSDVNDNDLMEFTDGWGQPIRFLRWAPGFVSRYQPEGDTSHDAFDPGNVDPLASQTLFPLVFSVGPDSEAGIQGRTDDVDASGGILFSYHRVRYDPWFVARGGGGYGKEFGEDLDPSADAENDNFFSHSMSR